MKNKHKWPMWAFWLSVFLLNILVALNNGLTTSADFVRNQIEFKAWQPYLWEFSSFISSFLLYFGVYWLAKKAPLFGINWIKHVMIHLSASVLFSVLHVVIMVLIRQVVYMMMGGEYDFGDWFSEWFYEFRKDILTYFVFVFIYYAFDYFTQTDRKPRLLDDRDILKVKNKKGVFWIKHSEISTIESGGNYVYIHTNEQVLPMRSTMAKMQTQLDSKRFIRVHRSFLVNLTHCQGMQKHSAHASELILSNGRKVPVSKKYRADISKVLEGKNHEGST